MTQMNPHGSVGRGAGPGRAQVLCVLSEEQAASYRGELAAAGHSELDFVFRHDVDDALGLFSSGPPAAVIIGMTIGPTEGLEVVAMIMQAHPDYTGPLIVLPDKGDPFPPMIQQRDPVTGRSSTEQTNLDALPGVLAKIGRGNPFVEAPSPVVKAGTAEPRQAVTATKEEAAAPLPTTSATKVAESGRKVASSTVFGLAPPPNAAAPKLVAPTPVIQKAVTPGLAGPDVHAAVTVPAPAAVVTVPAPATAAAAPGGVASEAAPSESASAAVGDHVPNAETPSEADDRRPLAAVVSAEPVAPRWVLSALTQRQRIMVLAAGGLLLLLLLLVVVLLAGGDEEASASEARAVAERVRPEETASGSVVEPRAKPVTREEQAAAVEELGHAEGTAKQEPDVEAEPAQARGTQVETGDVPTLRSGERVTLPLSFEADAAAFDVVDPDALREILRKVRRTCREDAEVRILVGGHTSEEGSAHHNEKLSLRRARRARRMLVNRGVPADRLSLRAYGTTHAASGADPGQNRRVTLEIQ